MIHSQSLALGSCKYPISAWEEVDALHALEQLVWSSSRPLAVFCPSGIYITERVWRADRVTTFWFSFAECDPPHPRTRRHIIDCADALRCKQIPSPCGGFLASSASFVHRVCFGRQDRVAPSCMCLVTQGNQHRADLGSASLACPVCHAVFQLGSPEQHQRSVAARGMPA
jgi:hypothetical protein